MEERQVGRIEEIDLELAELRDELEAVEGTETEVYSRIVGYYRSLRNWNRGKRAEFGERVTFAVAERPEARRIPLETEESEQSAPVGEPVRYELFVRDSCPNCPSMKAAAAQLEVAGRLIDVDSESGLRRAGELSIYATPTIVFFDAAGAEISRSSSVADIAANSVAVV
jgi:ribonucleoside-triphosphate reductase